MAFGLVVVVALGSQQNTASTRDPTLIAPHAARLASARHSSLHHFHHPSFPSPHFPPLTPATSSFSSESDSGHQCTHLLLTLTDRLSPLFLRLRKANDTKSPSQLMSGELLPAFQLIAAASSSSVFLCYSLSLTLSLQHTHKAPWHEWLQ